MENPSFEDGAGVEVNDEEIQVKEEAKVGEIFPVKEDVVGDGHEDVVETENGKGPSGFLAGIRHSAVKIGSVIKNKSKQKLNSSELGKKVSEKSMKYVRKWADRRKAASEKSEGYKSDRKIPKQGASQYRRGPIPLESLPSSDRCVARSSHGTLDSDDEDLRQSLPSSKGLLVYFRTLAKSTDENETVDLKFVDSLLEAGADINHEDRYVSKQALLIFLFV